MTLTDPKSQGVEDNKYLDQNYLLTLTYLLTSNTALTKKTRQKKEARIEKKDERNVTIITLCNPKNRKRTKVMCFSADKNATITSAT